MTFRIWGLRRKPADTPTLDEVITTEWLIARIITRDLEIDALCEMRARSLELTALLLGVTEEEAEQHIVEIKRALDRQEMEAEVLADIAQLPEEPA